MTHNGPNPSAWQRLEQLVEAVGHLAEQSASEPEFYRGLVQHVVQAGDAIAAAVWLSPPTPEPVPVWDEGDVHGRIVAGGADAEGLQTLLTRVANTREICCLLPRQDDGNGFRNPLDLPLALCPVCPSDRTERLLAVLLRTDMPAEAVHAFQDVLRAFCESATDFHRRLLLDELRSQRAWSRQIESFSAAVHRFQDLRATTYTVVQETRRVVGCDRVSLAVLRGRRAELLAVSGIDLPDRRAPLARAVEALAVQAARIDEIQDYEGNRQELPAQLAEPLEALVDQTHARRVVLVPLDQTSPKGDADEERRPLGSILLEWFSVADDRRVSHVQLESLRRHISIAVDRAWHLHRLPGRRFAEWLGGFREPVRAWRWTLGLGGLVAAILVLALVQVDLTVSCDGRLQPERRSRVFAPLDGQIETVHVQHGDRVAQHQTVASMFSRELELEQTRTLGELRTLVEQLESTRTTRMAMRLDSSDERQEQTRLTADEERIEKQVESLRQQQQLLERVREGLTLKSPIAGDVMTWQLHELLDQRPVRRGQLLMTIADLDGPWIVELDVADDDLGFVNRTAARRLNCRGFLRPRDQPRGDVSRPRVTRLAADRARPASAVEPR